MLESVRLKQTPLEPRLPNCHTIRKVLSCLANFFEIIEKDIVTLAVFYVCFCNIFGNFRMMADNL
jgi:hypothetical protein